MNFFTCRTIALVCALLVAQGMACAQETKDMYFRQTARTARAVAVADATIGDLRSAAGAAWNPASLAFLESISVDMTALGAVDGRMAQGDVAVPVALNDYFGAAVGGFAAAFDREDWSKQSGMLFGAVVSSGVRVTRSLGLGAAYTFQSGSFAGASATSHNVGIGLVYSGQPELTYAVTLTGLGSGIAYRQSDSLQFIERENSTPHIISIGGEWRYPMTHDRVILNYFFSGSKNLTSNQNTYRLGFEVLPWKFLALRAGFVSGPSTTTGRAGLGIRTAFGDFDYAIISSVAEDRRHVLTVSLPVFSR